MTFRIRKFTPWKFIQKTMALSTLFAAYRPLKTPMMMLQILTEKYDYKQAKIPFRVQKWKSRCQNLTHDPQVRESQVDTQKSRAAASLSQAPWERRLSQPFSQTQNAFLNNPIRDDIPKYHNSFRSQILKNYTRIFCESSSSILTFKVFQIAKKYLTKKLSPKAKLNKLIPNYVCIPWCPQYLI